MRLVCGLIGSVLGAFAIGFAIAAVLDPSGVGWALLLILMVVPAAVAFWLYALRVSITASEEGVCINSLSRTTRVSWDEISHCTPGYWGIEISLHDGTIRNASAVQKPNYATWFKLRTRADEVADALNARASGVRS
jgi:ABC-type sugar transport system permease subunit